LAVALDEPEDGASVSELEVVLVRGRAPDSTSVTVNGSVAKIDSSGVFAVALTIRGDSGEIDAVAQAPGSRVARTRRRLRVAPVPDWFRALPEADRPDVPLPSGIVFGPGPKEYTNVKDKSVLVWVPPGVFVMGADDGDKAVRPAHRVQLDGYFLGKYEV